MCSVASIILSLPLHLSRSTVWTGAQLHVNTDNKNNWSLNLCDAIFEAKSSSVFVHTPKTLLFLEINKRKFRLTVASLEEAKKFTWRIKTRKVTQKHTKWRSLRMQSKKKQPHYHLYTCVCVWIRFSLEFNRREVSNEWNSIRFNVRYRSNVRTTYKNAHTLCPTGRRVWGVCCWYQRSDRRTYEVGFQNSVVLCAEKTNRHVIENDELDGIKSHTKRSVQTSNSELCCAATSVKHLYAWIIFELKKKHWKNHCAHVYAKIIN